MANTIITGASTSTVTLNTNEVLAVTSTGSLFVPGGVINGSAATGQSVTIAGYVEVVYLWLAGANNVSISQSGIFRGHGGGTDIYLGVDTLGNVTGGSILNNAGMIVADANNITMFGDNNLVQNSVTILSRFLSVSLRPVKTLRLTAAPLHHAILVPLTCRKMARVSRIPARSAPTAFRRWRGLRAI